MGYDHGQIDTSVLAAIIDSVRRSNGMLPYVGTMSDYRQRHDAVDQIIAIAEHEQADPSEVARISYTNFIQTKTAWLHNAGYPLGAWVKQVGHYYRPPKPMADERGEPGRKTVYDRDTRVFDAKQKSDIARYEREGGGVPESVRDELEKLKRKRLKNL